MRNSRSCEIPGTTQWKRRELRSQHRSKHSFGNDFLAVTAHSYQLMARDFCHSTSGQTHVQVVGIVFNARGCIAVQEPSHKGDETMHTFSEREFRDAVGGFCTGVVVVTGLFENEPAGFTAQSFVSVSLSPPLVAICPSKTSSSWQKVRRSGHFG